MACIINYNNNLYYYLKEKVEIRHVNLTYQTRAWVRYGNIGWHKCSRVGTRVP